MPRRRCAITDVNMLSSLRRHKPLDQNTVGKITYKNDCQVLLLRIVEEFSKLEAVATNVPAATRPELSFPAALCPVSILESPGGLGLLSRWFTQICVHR